MFVIDAKWTITPDIWNNFCAQNALVINVDELLLPLSILAGFFITQAMQGHLTISYIVVSENSLC